MSFANRIANTQAAPIARSKCKLARFQTTLPNDDQAALQQVIDNPRWTASNIAALLADPDAPDTERLDVSTSSIVNHRGKRCSCYFGGSGGRRGT